MRWGLLLEQTKTIGYRPRDRPTLTNPLRSEYCLRTISLPKSTNQNTTHHRAIYCPSDKRRRCYPTEVSEIIGSNHGYTVIPPPSKKSRAKIDEVNTTSSLGPSTLDSNGRDSLITASYLEEELDFITPPPTEDFKGLQESPSMDCDEKVTPYYSRQQIIQYKESDGTICNGALWLLLLLQIKYNQQGMAKWNSHHSDQHNKMFRTNTAMYAAELMRRCFFPARDVIRW